MKKLLNILSIIVIFTSSATVSAYTYKNRNNNAFNPQPSKDIKPLKHLTLNNLTIFNINVSLNASGDNFVLNGISAYKTIRNEIINQYRVVFPNDNLKPSDFAFNSTKLILKKSWSIQLYNIDKKTPIKYAQDQKLVFPLNYKTLKNNALKVKITTNNKNVVIKNSNSSNPLKHVVIEGFLNKFIYTSKNANSNHKITTNLNKSAIENNLLKNNCIDFSNGIYNLNLKSNLFKFSAPFVDLKKAIYKLNQFKRSLISKAIVTNLNNQLKDETTKLNKLGFLETAQNNVPQSEVITLGNSDVDFFAINSNNSLCQFENYDLGSNWKIFIRINISKWNNYLKNYLAKKNTYVFGYLGTSTKNSQKYDIKNVTTFNLNFANLNYNSQNKIVINGFNSYQYIMDEIINQYNSMFYSQKQLNKNDFILNSTIPSKNKPWAIQIYNLNGITPIKNNKNQVLIFPNNYNTLINNALKIRIKTLNSNVINNSVTIKGFLDKFIYTNKNLNKNHDVGVEKSKSIQENQLQIDNVIDLTSKQLFLKPITKINLGKQKKANQVKNQIYKNWSALDKINVSSLIVSNLNKELNQETQYLNNHDLLRIANNKVTNAHKNHFNIKNLQLYRVDDLDNTLNKLNKNNYLALQGSKIYLQLNVSNWRYLNNYIGALNSYVYLYLGSVTKN